MKHQGNFRRCRIAAQAAAAFVAAAVLSGCADEKEKPATQTAARVNKEEITIHQINFQLQQQRDLRPEQAETASRQVLERLIDQELALQKASELKIDRDPRVLQQLEAARREIISRAYFERLGEAASRPSADEVKRYYDEHPALFKERRIYQLQELAIQASPEQVDTLRTKLEAAPNVEQFVDYLRKHDYRFVSNQMVRAAEQLPLASVASFAALQDGQALLNATPDGAQVVVVAASKRQPVDEAQARPAIEQFLLNERKRKIIADDLAALRGAASLTYMGKFAQGAVSAAPTPVDASLGIKSTAATAATAPTDAAAPAASAAIDTSTINKGLGLNK